MWEYIPQGDADNSLRSFRMKVIGGWIVMTYVSVHAGGGVHQVFVSDNTHQWKLEKTNG